MRFQGSRAIAAPPSAIWRALHQPDILQVIIPDCARIERQPGYRPESAGDFALSFEIGKPNVATGAEPIIGWLEVDRQRAPSHLTLTLTLNDTLYFMRIQGTIDLAEQGPTTTLRYTVAAELPNLRGIGWSAEAHAQSERIISGMLDRLAQVTERAPAAVAMPATADGHDRATRPQILAETRRGNIVLLPAIDVPAPTQSMLRRLISAQRQRADRQRQVIAFAIAGGVVGTLIGAALWWFRRGRTPR